MPYYKTSDAAAVAAFREWRESITAHQKAALALSAEVGANPERCCRYNDGRFAAFVFEPGQDVPAHFRTFPHVRDTYVPRCTTAEGKRIRDRIRELPKILTSAAYNRAIGFSPCLVSGMRLCEFPATVRQENMIYFMLPDDAPYTPPAHVAEILGSEYNQAMKAAETKTK